MFTLEQIKEAQSKITGGKSFPQYIQDLKQIGLTGFTTWVKDSHSDYLGKNNFQISSDVIYPDLIISSESNAEQFKYYLKIHQQGETDYLQFCRHCAETGIEKWIVSIEKMTCTYFDLSGKEILIEKIPE